MFGQVPVPLVSGAFRVLITVRNRDRRGRYFKRQRFLRLLILNLFLDFEGLLYWHAWLELCFQRQIVVSTVLVEYFVVRDGPVS